VLSSESGILTLTIPFETGLYGDVQPAHPKMGPLIAALADYVELSDEASD
jgi:hypothetical protein